MAGEGAGEAEEQELAAQAEAAADAIRAAALRLLKEGEVHPRLLVLAAARVAGELGAATALAEGEAAEEVLGVLAEALREAGLEHAEMLRAVTLPPAGNA